MAKKRPLPAPPPDDSPLVKVVRDKLAEDDAWDDIVDTAIEQARNGNSPARKFLAEIAVPPMESVTAADLERITRLRREAEQRLGGDAEEEGDGIIDASDEDLGAALKAAGEERHGGGDDG